MQKYEVCVCACVRACAWVCVCKQIPISTLDIICYIFIYIVIENQSFLHSLLHLATLSAILPTEGTTLRLLLGPVGVPSSCVVTSIWSLSIGCGAVLSLVEGSLRGAGRVGGGGDTTRECALSSSGCCLCTCGHRYSSSHRKRRCRPVGVQFCSAVKKNINLLTLSN